MLKRLLEPVLEPAREDGPPHRVALDRRRRSFVKPESAVPDAAQTGCAPPPAPQLPSKLPPPGRPGPRHDPVKTSVPAPRATVLSHRPLHASVE